MCHFERVQISAVIKRKKKQNLISNNQKKKISVSLLQFKLGTMHLSLPL